MRTTPETLATWTGAGILAAATNANIISTGGYLTSHAALVVALSTGVFAGARVVGAGVAGKIAAVIIAALAAGELYNFAATAERTVIERENGTAPLKDALADRNLALSKLKDAETGKISSARLSLALENQTKAKAEYVRELREGGRCKDICNGLKADAAKADTEVTAAAAEAQTMQLAFISAAKAEVEANPMPASATPLADRLGWAPWVLDLAMAGLLSFGSNGLAGVLIAFGAHGSQPAIPERLVPVPANDAVSEKSIPGNPQPPKGGGRRGRKSDKSVIDFSEKFKQRNGRAPSGGEIKAQFPELPTSTAYDYSQRARASA